MFLLLILFFLMIAVDVGMRWSFVRDLSASQGLVYAGSVALELIVLLLLIVGLTQEKNLVRRFGAKFWLLAAGLTYSFGLFSSWSFFTYFKTLPGVFAFSYLFSEPADFLSLMGSGVSFYKIAAILAVGFTWAFAAYFVVEKRVKGGAQTLKRGQRISVALLFISLIAIMNNNTRISPGVALPLTDALFSFKTAVIRQLKGQEGWVRLQQRLAGELPGTLEQKAQFNVVLIVNESLRRHNLGFYGYRGPIGDEDTTPKLGKILTDEFYKAIFFERALANATMTAVSIPSVLTGISPAQGYDAMHRSYVIYEQVNRLKNVRTALISSHSYKTGNFRAFLTSASLDYLWYRETDNLPAFNNVGADDRYVPERFQDFMGTVGKDEKFFAVLHTNGTHYPYVVPDSFKNGAAENTIEAYDASIRYLDSNLAKVFDELQRRGVLENTIVILTADHGESFGEDGSTGHFGRFTVYNSNVPLIVAIPAALEHSISPTKIKNLVSNVSSLVSNADIFPTIMDLYDLPYDPSAYPGSSLFTEIPQDRSVILYNLVDTGVKKSYLGVFRGTQGLVITRDETTAKLSASLHDFIKDPGATKDLFSIENAAQRREWKQALERFPLVASYGSVLSDP